MAKKNSKNKAKKVDIFNVLTFEGGIEVRTGGKGKMKNGHVTIKSEPASISNPAATSNTIVAYGQKKRNVERVDNQTLRVL